MRDSELIIVDPKRYLLSQFDEHRESDSGARNWSYLHAFYKFFYKSKTTRFYGELTELIERRFPERDKTRDALDVLRTIFAGRCTPRTVQNLIYRRCLPKRENIIYLAYSMGLTVRETNRLLGLASEFALHSRQVNDALHIACLSFRQTYAVYEEMLNSAAIQAVIRNLDGAETDIPLTRTTAMVSFTTHVFSSALTGGIPSSGIGSDFDASAIISFISDNQANMSQLRNNAYRSVLEMVRGSYLRAAGNSDDSSESVLTPSEAAKTARRIMESFYKISLVTANFAEEAHSEADRLETAGGSRDSRATLSYYAYAKTLPTYTDEDMEILSELVELYAGKESIPDLKQSLTNDIRRRSNEHSEKTQLERDLLNILLLAEDTSAERRSEDKRLAERAIVPRIDKNIERIFMREENVSREFFILIYIACAAYDDEVRAGDRELLRQSSAGVYSDTGELVYSSARERLDELLITCEFLPLNAEIPFDNFVMKLFHELALRSDTEWNPRKSATKDCFDEIITPFAQTGLYPLKLGRTDSDDVIERARYVLDVQLLFDAERDDFISCLFDGVQERCREIYDAHGKIDKDGILALLQENLVKIPGCSDADAKRYVEQNLKSIVSAVVERFLDV
jgi:hypothetical protein